MDLKSNPASPLLPENAALSISRLSLRPNVLPCSSPSSLPSPGLHLTVPRKKTGLLDDVRSNAFLDAMKASSPPPRMISKDSSDNQEDGEDVTFRTWLQKYPSGLSSFEKIASNAKGKQIVLFLDYDGTLSPIVDNPDSAFMSRSMRTAVRKAASCFPTAIISGRSCDKVLEFVKLEELYYAGSHGMDIMGPVQKSSFNDHARQPKTQQTKGKIFQPAREFLPMINEVFSSLVESTKGVTGAKVENNKFCVSVHYRNVDPTDWPAVGDIVQDILKDYPRLRMTHGRKVIEVRPVIDWDKGKAVTFLLESLGLKDREDMLPIYVGDDRTDEDAFKVLREGNRGHGILVTSVPKDSNAHYSLRDPTEVMQFLKLLLNLKNSNAL